MNYRYLFVMVVTWVVVWIALSLLFEGSVSLLPLVGGLVGVVIGWLIIAPRLQRR